MQADGYTVFRRVGEDVHCPAVGSCCGGMPSNSSLFEWMGLERATIGTWSSVSVSLSLDSSIGIGLLLLTTGGASSSVALLSVSSSEAILRLLAEDVPACGGNEWATVPFWSRLLKRSISFSYSCFFNTIFFLWWVPKYSLVEVGYVRLPD